MTLEQEKTIRALYERYRTAVAAEDIIGRGDVEGDLLHAIAGVQEANDEDEAFSRFCDFVQTFTCRRQPSADTLVRELENGARPTSYGDILGAQFDGKGLVHGRGFDIALGQPVGVSECPDCGRFHGINSRRSFVLAVTAARRRRRPSAEMKSDPPQPTAAPRVKSSVVTRVDQQLDARKAYVAPRLAAFGIALRDREVRSRGLWERVEQFHYLDDWDVLQYLGEPFWRAAFGVLLASPAPLRLTGVAALGREHFADPGFGSYYLHGQSLVGPTWSKEHVQSPLSTDAQRVTECATFLAAGPAGLRSPPLADSLHWYLRGCDAWVREMNAQDPQSIDLLEVTESMIFFRIGLEVLLFDHLEERSNENVEARVRAALQAGHGGAERLTRSETQSIGIKRNIVIHRGRSVSGRYGLTLFQLLRKAMLLWLSEELRGRTISEMRARLRDGGSLVPPIDEVRKILDLSARERPLDLDLDWVAGVAAEVLLHPRDPEDLGASELVALIVYELERAREFNDRATNEQEFLVEPGPWADPVWKQMPLERRFEALELATDAGIVWCMEARDSINRDWWGRRPSPDRVQRRFRVELNWSEEMGANALEKVEEIERSRVGTYDLHPGRALPWGLARVRACEYAKRRECDHASQGLRSPKSRC